MATTEKATDNSHRHTFKVELAGPLLGGWIFASSYCLKDQSAGFGTVELDTPAGTKPNRARISAVRILHH